MKARKAYNEVDHETKKRMWLLKQLARDGAKTDMDVISTDVYYIINSPKFSKNDLYTFLDIQKNLNPKGNNAFFNYIFDAIVKDVERENAAVETKDTISAPPTIEQNVICSQNNTFTNSINPPRRPVLLTDDNDYC